MRMTRQELRDEMKDAEGRPEIRARIRRRQKEVAQARMLERIRDADVVITNPEHFAVALAYDPSREGAPVVVAKGVDEVAFRMIARAREHGVQTFAAPPLARAIYFTTRLEQAIPEELYYAVAQVIAYVFSLAAYRREGSAIEPPAVDIPPTMRFDVEGRRETAGEQA
jgi:flagellar biosynthetic protein FlhB